MSVLRNGYFTYSPGADPRAHRDPQQVWNIHHEGEDYQIWVQGDLTGTGFTYKMTFFAKKHLLTFRGGKAAAKGETPESKMARILTKRNFRPTTRQKKGKDPFVGDLLRITNKYSQTPAKNANAMINCDAITDSELKLLILTALIGPEGPTTGSMAYVTFELPADAVLYASSPSGQPGRPPVTSAQDTVTVQLGCERYQKTFAILHMEVLGQGT
jgi:hypothetical protein